MVCIQEDCHGSHKKVACSIYGLAQLLPSKHSSRLSYALPRLIQQYMLCGLSNPNMYMHAYGYWAINEPHISKKKCLDTMQSHTLCRNVHAHCKKQIGCFNHRVVTLISWLILLERLISCKEQQCMDTSILLQSLTLPAWLPHHRGWGRYPAHWDLSWYASHVLVATALQWQGLGVGIAHVHVHLSTIHYIQYVLVYVHKVITVNSHSVSASLCSDGNCKIRSPIFSCFLVAFFFLFQIDYILPTLS